MVFKIKKRRTRKEKEFVPKQLKVVAKSTGEARVQKTVSLRQETHHALAYRAYELNLWESDVAEMALCLFLGINS